MQPNVCFFGQNWTQIGWALFLASVIDIFLNESNLGIEKMGLKKKELQLINYLLYFFPSHPSFLSFEH